MRSRFSRKRRSTPAMSTDSLSLLTEPGGSSKRPRSRPSSLASRSFREFFLEIFREDNWDSVMTEILRLLHHQQNPQPTVISTSSVDVPGTVSAIGIVLPAVTIAGARFRCRAVRPSIPSTSYNLCLCLQPST